MDELLEVIGAAGMRTDKRRGSCFRTGRLWLVLV